MPNRGSTRPPCGEPDGLGRDEISGAEGSVEHVDGRPGPLQTKGGAIAQPTPSQARRWPETLACQL